MSETAALGPYGRMAYGGAMATLGTVSVAGYYIFMRAIWGRRDLQKRSIFLTSLCFSDLLLIGGHLVLTVCACFFPKWPFGDIGCQFHAFVGMAASYVSIANAAMIAFDTYYRECKKEKLYVNYGFYLAIVWIAGMVLGFLPVIGFGSYTYESGLEAGCLLDLEDKNSGMLYYLALISVVYFAYPMYKIIKYYGMLKKETGDGFLLAFVPIQMLVAWSPYAIFSIALYFVGPAQMPQVGLAIASNLSAKLFMASNPYIYVLSDRDLRVACCQVLFGGANPKPVSNDKGNDEKKSE